MLRTTLLLSLLTVPAFADDLRVGAASVDITPPVGTPMAGYYHERPSTGVHDPLFAKAIVLRRGDRTAALVSLDLIATTKVMVDQAREGIEKETGIPGANVMISATHAHTGPVLQSRGKREDDFGGKNPLAKAYHETLVKRIVEAVKAANSDVKDATANVARGSESSIAFNRRFHMKDGTVGWNPGKKNPAILKPAGTIDPDVEVVLFESEGKTPEPIATYVNYAVHFDNVGGTEFSADVAATVSASLAKVLGPKPVTVYTSGCCGDINHIDVNWAARQHGHENAARMGLILSGEVLRTWPKLRPVDSKALRVKTAIVRLPLAKITPEDIEVSRSTLAKSSQSSGGLGFLELVKAYQVRDVEDRQGEPIEVEVQVITLGDELAWVSLPGEVFVELGLAIKQDSPFPHTIIAELANGAIGYIPSRRAYGQGNYEAVSARCAEGSGEMLVDAAVKLLKELHAEATR